MRVKPDLLPPFLKPVPYPGVSSLKPGGFHAHP
jgi:hypothetical protein